MRTRDWDPPSHEHDKERCAPLLTPNMFITFAYAAYTGRDTVPRNVCDITKPSSIRYHHITRSPLTFHWEKSHSWIIGSNRLTTVFPFWTSSDSSSAG